MRYFLFAVLFAILVISGNAFAAPVQLTGTDRALEVRGAASGDALGRPLVCLDLNGDGFEDMVIGKDISDYYGTVPHPLYIFMGKGSFAAKDLVDLSTENADVVIFGETGSMNFANSLAAGDVNHDGIPDLVMADSTFSPSGRTGAGVVYVLFGRTDFFSKTVYDFASGEWDIRIIGALAGDDTGGSSMFGGMICEALACGDLNNDGIDDLGIGAHLANVSSWSDAGKVFIVFGKSSFTHGTTIDLNTQANSVITGNETYGELGTQVDIGDINGDGIADLVLGEEYGSKGLFTSEGMIFAVWGRSSFPATLSVSSANLIIKGAAEEDYLGSAVALSDLNRDGVKDLTVTSGGDAGDVYGFYGKTSFPSVIDLASQSADFVIQGYNVENDIGGTLYNGDFNGDGFGDIMFSSRDGERPGYDTEGRTYILFGKTSLPSTISIQNEEFDCIINGGMDYYQLGDTIASGDVDGDGADEILIAAPFVDSGKGRLLVFDLNPRTAVSSFWNLYE
ncbi:FG-GAP repeat protein [Candidatus Sumerlaeota bacterium]|nr:FG-GAP repeat protein [Candidatus Sumerlaeota bacterium]